MNRIARVKSGAEKNCLAISLLLAVSTVVVVLVLGDSGSESRIGSRPDSDATEETETAVGTGSRKPGDGSHGLQPISHDGHLGGKAEVADDLSGRNGEESTQESAVSEGAGRLNGAIVDKRFGHAVPFARVSCSSESLSIQCTSDRSGRFEFDQELDFGSYLVVVFDSRQELGRSVIDHSGGANGHSLLVTAGPTIHCAPSAVVLQEPGWEVRIVQFPKGTWGLSSERTYNLHVAGDGLRFVSRNRVSAGATSSRWESFPGHSWSWLALRSEDSGSWARYLDFQFDPDSDLQAMLQFRNRSKGALAVAAAPSSLGPMMGIDPHASNDSLSFGAMRIKVEGLDGARVAVMQVDQNQGQRAGLSYFSEEALGRDGELNYQQVPVGRWRVVVLAEGTQPIEQTVFVQTGKTAVVDLELEHSGLLSQVSVLQDFVENPARSDGLHWYSVLTPVVSGGTVNSWIAPESLRVGDPSRRSFLHYGVPPGAYTAQVYAIGLGPASSFEVTPIELTPIELIYGPNTTQEERSFKEWFFEVRRSTDAQLQGAEALDWAISVTDARGEKVEGYYYYIGPTGGHVVGGHSGRALPKLMPGVRGDVAWSIGAVGYAPAFGRIEQFQLDGDALNSKVTLHPGWGATIYFLAGRPSDLFEGFQPWSEVVRKDNLAALSVVSAPPVPGVSVRFRGRELGVSGPDGAVRLRCDVQPEVLEVSCAGWVPTAVMPIRPPSDGNWTGVEQFVVWLEPEFMISR